MPSIVTGFVKDKVELMLMICVPEPGMLKSMVFVPGVLLACCTAHGSEPDVVGSEEVLITVKVDRRSLLSSASKRGTNVLFPLADFRVSLRLVGEKKSDIRAPIE